MCEWCDYEDEWADERDSYLTSFKVFSLRKWWQIWKRKRRTHAKISGVTGERVVDMDASLWGINPDLSSFTTLMMKMNKASSLIEQKKVYWLEDELFPRVIDRDDWGFGEWTDKERGEIKVFHITPPESCWMKYGEIMRNTDGRVYRVLAVVGSQVVVEG